MTWQLAIISSDAAAVKDMQQASADALKTEVSDKVNSIVQSIDEQVGVA